MDDFRLDFLGTRESLHVAGSPLSFDPKDVSVVVGDFETCTSRERNDVSSERSRIATGSPLETFSEKAHVDVTLFSEL